MATALTPIITIAICIVTYRATTNTEAEKNRTERIKLVADLYNKALTQDSAYVLYNTANLTKALLLQNPDDSSFSRTIANNLNALANHKAAIKPIQVSRNVPVMPEQLGQQKTLFNQLNRNATLTAQATGDEAANAAAKARHELTASGNQSDDLAYAGYSYLVKGKIDSAQKYFTLADFAYPERYNYYELSHYLKIYGKSLPAPTQQVPRQLTIVQQKEVAKLILAKYPGRIPGNIQTKLTAQANYK